MKKQILFFMLLLLTLVSCGGTGDAPQKEKGTSIKLDFGNTASQDFTDSHIFGFDLNQKLIYHKYYSTPVALSSDLFSLSTGAYTFVAVLNVGEKFLDGTGIKVDATKASLSTTQLLNHLKNTKNQFPKMQTGMISRDVNAEEKIVVEIPVKNNILGLQSSTLRFNLALPNIDYADYVLIKSRSIPQYGLRGVVELYQTGKTDCLLHTAVALNQTTEPGQYTMDVEMAEGSYDILMWVDYSQTGLIDDINFNTKNLKAIKYISIAKEYSINGAPRQVFYTKSTAKVDIKNPVTLKNMTFDHPMAKYDIVTDDLEHYRSLAQINPNNYPALSELRISVLYEGFLPDGFNVQTGKPNDSETGYLYKSDFPLASIAAAEAKIGTDYVLDNGDGSSVKVTIQARDKSGRLISQVKGVEIKYRKGLITTVKGDFLTAGVINPGINIDTNWSGSHEVTFE